MKVALFGHNSCKRSQMHLISNRNWRTWCLIRTLLQGRFVNSTYQFPYYPHDLRSHQRSVYQFLHHLYGSKFDAKKLDKKEIVEKIRQALYFSKIVSYAQGFEQMRFAFSDKFHITVFDPIVDHLNVVSSSIRANISHTSLTIVCFSSDLIQNRRYKYRKSWL